MGIWRWILGLGVIVIGLIGGFWIFWTNIWAHFDTGEPSTMDYVGPAGIALVALVIGISIILVGRRRPSPR